jgi:hypothetical protein
VVSAIKIAGFILAAALPAVVWGQSPCPIQITSVDPHAVSAIGGSALRVVYRNESPTPVSAVSFQVRFGERGRAITLTEHQPLAASKSDSAQWNETAWLTPAAVMGIRADQITVWPATVAFADGSVWRGTPECAFRSNEAESVPLGISSKDSIPVGATAENTAQSGHIDQPIATSYTQPMTAEQKMALIDAGKASLCTVRSYPEGANVDVDGKLLGQTPLSFVLLKGTAPRELYLYKTGYKIASRAVLPNGSALAISVTLEPLRTTN